MEISSEVGLPLVISKGQKVRVPFKGALMNAPSKDVQSCTIVHVSFSVGLDGHTSASLGYEADSTCGREIRIPRSSEKRVCPNISNQRIVE